jgi:hypothetical protein
MSKYFVLAWNNSCPLVINEQEEGVFKNGPNFFHYWILLFLRQESETSCSSHENRGILRKCKWNMELSECNQRVEIRWYSSDISCKSTDAWFCFLVDALNKWREIVIRLREHRCQPWYRLLCMAMSRRKLLCLNCQHQTWHHSIFWNRSQQAIANIFHLSE